jgi:membrane protein implicated in regulation of membrane protease activity
MRAVAHVAGLTLAGLILVAIAFGIFYAVMVAVDAMGMADTPSAALKVGGFVAGSAMAYFVGEPLLRRLTERVARHA